jgi:hypothetical protein
MKGHLLMDDLQTTGAEGLSTDSVLAPQVGGGVDEQELQPVPSMPEEPAVPEKVLGEFATTEDARVELERLRSFRDAVSRDQGVQQLVQQRQQAQVAQERAKLSIQAEEQHLLEQYAEAVAGGNPDKALLTLVREIRGQARNDAQAAIRHELATATEPLRAKAQLLESTAWADLHPVADEATWLAGELGKLGHSKPAVAEFLRTIGKKYSSPKSPPPPPQSQRRGGGWNMESPDSGAQAPTDDRGWDKQVDNYWKERGF